MVGSLSQACITFFVPLSVGQRLVKSLAYYSQIRIAATFEDSYIGGVSYKSRRAIII